MSINKRIAFGATASWFSRGVTILLGLVLLPVLFRHLPKEELGVWMLLGQSWAALGIFDLGFGTTLTRRIAFAKGKSGSDPSVALTDETLREIADLVATGKIVYRALCVFAFITSMIAGFFYLRTLHLGSMPLSMVWLAWGVLCLSQALGVWANVWNCVLLGVGYVGWDAVLGSIASALTLLAQIIVACCGGGLVALAVAAAVGALTQRFLMLGFARSRRPEIFSIQGQWKPALVKSMVPLALRAWLMVLGGVLVFQTDQFFIAKMKGVGDIPAYRAAFVILVNLNMLAVTVAGASAVFISHLWQAGEQDEVRRLALRNLRLALLVMCIGSAFVLATGPQLFDWWLGPGHFIGYPILAVFCLSQLLEVQAYVISTISRATEDEAFAWSGLAGGVVKLFLSWFLLKKYGLFGLAISSLLAMGLTNHWYMVYRGLKRLGIPLTGYVLKNVGVLMGIFLAMFAVLIFFHRLGAEWSMTLSLLVGGVLSSIGLGAVLWWWVFNRSERDSILRRVGSIFTF
jgi:O-antigen/teichoic acid export membrane protein